MDQDDQSDEGFQNPRPAPGSPGLSPLSEDLDAEKGQMEWQEQHEELKLQNPESQDTRETEMMDETYRREAGQTPQPESPQRRESHDSPLKKVQTEQKGTQGNTFGYLKQKYEQYKPNWQSIKKQSLNIGFDFGKLFKNEQTQKEKSSTAPPSSCKSESTTKPEPKSKHLSIFSDIDIPWLTDHLNNDPVSGTARVYRQLPLTSNSLQGLKDEALVMLCLSHASCYEGIVKDFLERCCNHIIIIITGNNTKTEKEKREYWKDVCKKLKLSKFDVITLTQQDEEIISNRDSGTRERLNVKMKAMKEILINPAATNKFFSLLKSKVNVGIFSRSGESDYAWLVELLKSAEFSDRVQDVLPCYISNLGHQKFRDDVSECKFGILYHTKNRGRINVTDVTDALYDEELEYLSSTLGRDNVIVVIDDLEESSDAEKNRILQSQKSIERLAKDLLLFCHDEKLRASAEMKMTQLRALIAESNNKRRDIFKIKKKSQDGEESKDLRNSEASEDFVPPSPPEF